MISGYIMERFLYLNSYFWPCTISEKEKEKANKVFFSNNKKKD